MIDYMRALQPSAIEIIDPGHLPLAMVDGFLELGVPHAMFVGDAALIGDAGLRAAARDCRMPRSVRPPIPRLTTQRRDAANRWQEITAAADNILVPSEHAWDFALNHFDEPKLIGWKPSTTVKDSRSGAEVCEKFRGLGCCRSVPTARNKV